MLLMKSAQDKTRTCTSLRIPAPQAGVSTNSTTWAIFKRTNFEAKIIPFQSACKNKKILISLCQKSPDFLPDFFFVYLFVLCINNFSSAHCENKPFRLVDFRCSDRIEGHPPLTDLSAFQRIFSDKDQKGIIASWNHRGGFSEMFFE